MKNIELSKEKFNQIIVALQKGNDEYFEQFIYLDHLDYCIKYLKTEHKAKHHEAYSCTVNTLLEIREELTYGKIEYKNLNDRINNLIVKKYSALNSKVKQKKSNNNSTLPRNKNFGLSEEEFNALVRDLQNGDDKLFQQIYLQHFEICLRFLINHRSAEYENAYSSTMEALIGIRKDLIRGKIKYGNLAYYYTFRACKKLSKLRDKGNNKMQLEGIGNLDFKDSHDLVEEIETTEMAELVKKALDMLDEKCRKILKLYYYEGLTWEKIAEFYYPEIKSNTLRRSKDRKCLPAFKGFLKNLLG